MSNDYKGLPLKVWVQGVGAMIFISLVIIFVSTPLALFRILERKVRRRRP